VASLLETRGLTKSYEEVRALKGVDFTLSPGEVVGLVGANGAGKSTLLKILTGTVRPDAGDVLVDGEPIESDVRAAQAAGIAAVHQELSLVPTASIAENILLWHLPRKAGFVSRRSMHERAAAVLERLGVDLPLDMPAAACTAVQQRLVMVASAMSQDARILILDEPTASLPPEEADHVLQVARGLRDLGKTVVFVSHRLDEVRELVDRAVIMRDGEVVRELGPGELKVDAMMELIGAKKVAELDVRLKQNDRAAGEVVLSARGLSGTRISELDLDVRAGEILGIAGLIGAGRSELLRLLAGVQKPSAGEIQVHGRPWRSGSAISGKIGYVGERRGDHLFVDFDVTGNVSLPSLRDFKHRSRLLHRKREVDSVGQVLQRIQVKGRPQDDVSGLSGGNKQKILLARWLLVGSKILLLDEPTSGIDVGARAEMHALLRGIAESGGAVVVAIAEPKELLSLCNRVVVLREGHLTHDTDAPFDEGEIIAASYAHLNGRRS
jgi:ABC-type sugar transport system ATPase subunit